MHSHLAKWLITVCLTVLFARSAGAADGELTAYKDAVLAENSINDGDSFFVRAGEEIFHVRLYFVDSPETVVYADHDARRVREQARYFGIESAERILWLGNQAAQFCQQVLSRPFILYTSHTRALGGANSHRIYGFIKTANGRDLGELLVENGYARNFGVKRSSYDGRSIAETALRLEDLEASAMLGRRGIWSESNASKIAQYRAEQREERRALREIMTSNIVLLEQPVDINSASRSELERVPGIGPVMAARIIQNRPFAVVEELETVQGIGTKTLEKMRPFIRVDTSVTNG